MSFSVRAIAFAKLWLFSFVLSIGLLAPGTASADGRPFSRIVVFGDSLSDSGNLFALGPVFGLDAPGALANNWGMNTDEELLTLVPGQAYISGRLSNGPTWVELLGTALGMGANVKPVFANTADLRRFNFAVAGATATNFGTLPAQFNLSGQVGAYLARPAVDASFRTLYVIAVGGNDVRAAVGAATVFGPEVAPVIMGQALDAVEQAIRVLSHQGAKFLIWNIPDLGTTPAFDRLESVIPGAAEFATGLIAGPLPDRDGGYNAALKARLRSLSIDLGVELLYFDAFQELTEVRERPRRYGLTNVNDPCIQVVPYFAVPGACAHPDRYLFWDGIHPTRAGHAIIAFLVGKALIEAAAEH